MQTFVEFLRENYELSEEDFEELNTSEKRNIDSEYDSYVDTIIK